MQISIVSTHTHDNAKVDKYFFRTCTLHIVIHILITALFWAENGVMLRKLFIEICNEHTFHFRCNNEVCISHILK